MNLDGLVALNGLDLCSYLEVLDGLEVLDNGLEVLDDGLKVLNNSLKVFDGFEALTSFSRTDWLTRWV